MPDIKITELPSTSVLNETDQIIVEQADGTKRAEIGILPAGVPDGGTTDQVLTKLSSEDGDADWQNAGIWHGNEVGDLPVPINADQLQGHPASYFDKAEKLTLTGKTLDTVTLPNATVTVVGSYNLPQGRYIVKFGGRFATNSTGYRNIGISTTKTGLPSYNDTWLNFAPAPSDVTKNQITALFDLSETTTIYFLARQNSGGDLNFSRGIYDIYEL